MGEDDLSNGDVEYLDTGARPLAEMLRGRGRAWLAAVALAVVALGVFAVVRSADRPSGPPAGRAATVPRSLLPRSTSAVPTPTVPASILPIAVTRVAGPLLGIHATWDLFGRGDAMIVRVELGRGRIVRTAVPELSSNGPVSFIVGSTWAVIRPLDFVPGYLVRDGQRPRALAGMLGRGGDAFPGPDPDHVWVPMGSGPWHRFGLVDVAGRSTGVSIRVPPGNQGVLAIPDQTGHILFADPDRSGAYVARPDRVTRIPASAVLAVGPTRLLTSECDNRHRCRGVVVNRTTGARRALSTHVGGFLGPTGLIAPNGTVAALPVESPSPAIAIVNLTTGAAHDLQLGVDPSKIEGGSMVWSPDSRWLFAIDEAGDVYAFDAHSDNLTNLTNLTVATGHALRGIRQLAIRSDH